MYEKDPPLPGAPEGLTATSVNSTVTLTWLVAANGGVPDDFIIEAGSAPGLATLARFSTGTTATTYVADGVPNGLYFIRVRAVNAGGTSPPSAEARVRVGLGPPDPPSDLIAWPQESRVTLQWTAPSTGDPPTSYTVEAGSGPGLANLARISTGSAATLYFASGVPHGRYYLRVRGSNSAGEGSPSNEVAIDVNGPCTTLPNAPRDLRIVANSGGNVVIAWTSPRLAAVYQLQSYVLEVGSAPGRSDIERTDLVSTSTSYSRGGIGRGVYYARIRARNLCGLSEASNEIFVDVRVGIFAPVGSMRVPRVAPTMTRLNDGRVLVVGGLAEPPASGLDNPELYDPATRTWTPTLNQTVNRDGHTATLLQDGRVLVVSETADIFDPATNSWTPASPPATPRSRHAAALLSDGRVLIVGGMVWGGEFTSAEIYDPATDSWTPAGNLAVRRAGPTATRLADGRILVAGGMQYHWDRPSLVGDGDLRVSEIYDPSTGAWSTSGKMLRADTALQAILLPDGRVFTVDDQSSELFDPATETWSLCPPMLMSGYGLAVTLLFDGRVLVTGGRNLYGYQRFTEVFDPTTNTWSPFAPLVISRASHGAVVLANGDVLVAGGYTWRPTEYLASAELYQFPAPPIAPAEPTALPACDKQVQALPIVERMGISSRGKDMQMRCDRIPTMAIFACLASAALCQTAWAQPKTPTQAYLEHRARLASAKTLADILPGLSAEYRAMLESRPKADQPTWLARIKEVGVKDMRIVKETITGNRCVLEGTGIGSIGLPMKGTISLVKEGGVWKLDEEGWGSTGEPAKRESPHGPATSSGSMNVSRRLSNRPYLRITPHAMRSPALPDGSVFMSSALA